MSLYEKLALARMNGNVREQVEVITKKIDELEAQVTALQKANVKLEEKVTACQTQHQARTVRYK